MTTQSQGRKEHYGVFYGLHPLPAPDGRPLIVVWGNCQAEALRQLLSTDDGTEEVRSVRVPPVHELTADDLPLLRKLLSHTDILLSQPVSDNYRDLPLGTEQVARMLPTEGTLLRWPVLFYAGLYPFQALVRHPSAGDPPIVPYHDLRTLIEAATGRRPEPPTDPVRYQRLAERSWQELVAREKAHHTLSVSPGLTSRDPSAFHTINHPGNVTLVATARCVQRQLDVAVTAAAPERILLRSVLTPQEPLVFDALGLSVEPGRADWLLNGEAVPDEEVRRAHLSFYREFPAFLDAGLQRHARTIVELGLLAT